MSSRIREKFVEQMELYGLSKFTQKGYITGVKGLAKHYNQTPESLTDDQVRAYFRHLLTKRKLEWSSCKNYLCGITYFYRHISKRESYSQIWCLRKFHLSDIPAGFSRI